MSFAIVVGAWAEVLVLCACRGLRCEAVEGPRSGLCFGRVFIWQWSFYRFGKIFVEIGTFLGSDFAEFWGKQPLFGAEKFVVIMHKRTPSAARGFLCIFTNGG